MPKRQRPKRSVFVIMPFTKTPLRNKDDLTAFFEVNLKQRIESDASLKYQYVVRRSDDSFDITAKIIRDVYEADIVLCDLSGNDANPNVMYELGVRLAISNKPVILFREANPDNNPIFDIAGFYAREYRPQQYKNLEDYVIAKLRKFESGQETYQSPVLKVLKTEPTVMKEINRKRVTILLGSFRNQVTGLQRALGGAVHGFLNVYNIQHKFETPDEMLDFIQENSQTLIHLPWASLQFLPHTMPALTTFLVELPLSDMIPEKLEREVNTFISEYYNIFLSSAWCWQPPTFSIVLQFLGESYYLRQLLAGCTMLTQQMHDAEAEKIISEMRQFLKKSVFNVFAKEDEETVEIPRAATKRQPDPSKAKPSRKPVGKKKASKAKKNQPTAATKRQPAPSKAKPSRKPVGKKKASKAKKNQPTKASSVPRKARGHASRGR